MLDCADERPYHNDVVARLVLAWWVGASPGVAGLRNVRTRERGVLLTYIPRIVGRKFVCICEGGLDKVQGVA